MDWSGIITNLNNGLQEFNGRYQEILNIITNPIETYMGGTIYKIVADINGGLKAIGYSMVVVFGLISYMKSSISFQDMKRPEQFLRVVLNFILGKGAIDFGLPLMLLIFNMGLKIITSIASKMGDAASFVVPSEIMSAVGNMTGLFDGLFPYLVSFLCNIIIMGISMIILLTVYGRFFKVYMYLAIAPIPLATFSGEGTSQIGKTFLKGFIGVILEGALIVLACIIYQNYATSPPTLDGDATSMIFKYMGQNIFNMLVLLGVIKMTDRVVKEMGF